MTDSKTPSVAWGNGRIEMFCPDCGHLDMVYTDCKICNAADDAKPRPLQPSPSQLSPASRAAYEELCRGVLAVLLANEGKHPGDDFLKLPVNEHYWHLLDHLASGVVTPGSLDPDTGLLDLHHAGARLALLAARQKVGK